MEITFTLDKLDPPTVVVADSRDIYVWERTDKTQRRSLRTLLERLAMSDLYPLAWVTARRTLGYTGTEAEFVDTYPALDFDTQEDADEAGPTLPVPSPTPSLSLPSGPEFPPTSGQMFPNAT